MEYKLKLLLTFALIASLFLPIVAQDKEDEKAPNFEMIYEVETTPIKTQYRTGTCWTFATTSFWETELMRTGKEAYDISEMYTVRMAYPLKAEKYIRLHGKTNLSEGGQAHDVLHIFDKFGMVPETVYDGNIDNPKTYNHRELVSVLKGALDGVLKQSGKITANYKDVTNAILDIYLGEPPQEFEYNGKLYTPKSFFEESGLNTGNYVELTSYLHHPFYSKFVLEVPDNWTDDYYYNVPIDDLISVMDNAIKRGYSIAWDGDTGRDNFYRDKGYAVIPKDDDAFDFPLEEKTITQKIRQEAFDNFDVTDDHLMHIVGIAKDDSGKKFYYTKNSWGTEGKVFDGYWYLSESYVRLKTIAILVHKDAIPEKIKEKLGL